MKREPTPEGRALPLATARRAGLRILAGAAVAVCTAHAVAQAPRAPAAASATAPVREEGVRWQALTPAQREALAPLERDWPGIDAPRKQKWIALAGRFNTLSPEERARINARMVEWAKLTPAERGQARLRFEEARQLPVPDRSERWRAYQALPPEQRQQLAARAATAASAPRERRLEAGQGRARQQGSQVQRRSQPGPGAAAASGRADDGPGRARCDDDGDHAPARAPAASAIGHAEDRDDTRIREPLDLAAPARPAGRRGHIDTGCCGPAGGPAVAGSGDPAGHVRPTPAPPAPAPLAATPASAPSR